MPTMSWRFVNATQPIFNVKETLSNTGILTELFRNLPEVRRSLHPTHSVAGRGKLATTLLATHQQSQTPCDAFSPFGQLAVGEEVHVIMFGVGMDCCTLVHCVEELQAPSFYVKPDYDDTLYYCYDATQQAHTVKLRRHQFLPSCLRPG